MLAAEAAHAWQILPCTDWSYVPLPLWVSSLPMSEVMLSFWGFGKTLFYQRLLLPGKLGLAVIL